MSPKNADPDLPGEANFVPAPPLVEVIIDTPFGPASAMAMTISAEEQAIQHHNLLRYAELGKLRRGQPNSYLETRYRR